MASDETTKMSKAAMRRLIQETNWKLERALAHTRYWSTYIAECERGEKEHRKWGRDFSYHHPSALPVKVCAKHFANKWVLLALTNEADEPKVRDIFSVQLASFQGFALVSMYREEIEQHITRGQALAYLVAIDYCNLVGPMRGDA